MYLSFQETYDGLLEKKRENTMTFKEALTTADATVLIPKAISLVMTEAAEPMYLASQFFHPVTITAGRSMEFINFGAIRAFDIGEGQEYPEQNLDFTMYGGPTTEVKIGKVGLKVNITDEMISDANWDVIGLHLRAAARAMARKKEEKCFVEFTKHGHCVFDGDAGDASPLKPTGRGWNGEENDTLTAQDMMDMCISVMAAGFTPTDVIMHPLCWSLFAKNEMLQDMSVSAFGGSPTAIDPANVIKSAKDLLKTGKAAYQVPVQGLRINFSPWVPFDQVRKKFDMYIVDRNNIGIMLIKDKMGTEQFTDPLRDIMTLKVMERYGLGVTNGGLGVAVAKNVKYERTYAAPERQFEPIARPADTNGALNDRMNQV